MSRLPLGQPFVTLKRIRRKLALPITTKNEVIKCHEAAKKCLDHVNLGYKFL